MISFLRWTGRVLFTLGVLGLLACGFVVWRFTDWRTQRMAQLDAGSTIAETKAGKVEYTERGSGPAVLVCHGAPGGYDQALLIGESLADAGYRVIAPSRPGFLRTPLATGLFFQDQADALAALLDTLGVNDAAVIGFSSGAQVAMQFALRHPGKTRGLVLLSPVTRQYIAEQSKEERLLLPESVLIETTGDMGSWLVTELADRNPRRVLQGFLALDTTLDESGRAKLADAVLGNPKQLEFFRGLAATQAPSSPRETGTRNDLVMLCGLLPSPFEKITVPVVAVFGANDASAEWCDPKDISAWLPKARIVTVDDAGHSVWFGPNAGKMEAAVRDFLGGLKTGAPPPDEALPE